MHESFKDAKWRGAHPVEVAVAHPLGEGLSIYLKAKLGLQGAVLIASLGECRLSF
jgi:hypothetical protein